MSEILNYNISFQFGDIEIISLNDAVPNLAAREMFPSVSESKWEDFYHTYPNAFQDIDTGTPRISCTFIRTQTS